MKSYYIYILANKPYGTVYIGVTSNLEKRIYEHKNDFVKGFTEKYKVHSLVYFEETDNVNAALQREKNLKAWVRGWKIDLINKNNPEWKDLSEDFYSMDPRVKPEDDSDVETL